VLSELSAKQQLKSNRGTVFFIYGPCRDDISRTISESKSAEWSELFGWLVGELVS
jgi:hypothetical protein